MVLDCKINFDQNVNGVYFAGQLLSGNVTVNLNKTKKLRGILFFHLMEIIYEGFSFTLAICLHITGSAECGWTEQSTTGAGKHRRTHSTHYRGREDYVSTSTYLVPGSAVGECRFSTNDEG